MKIVFINDENLHLIFPESKKYGGDQNILLDEIKNYFTFGPYTPKVSLSDNLITIDIDTPTIYRHENEYQKVVSLCTKGKYGLAKPILNRLIKENPSVSEYHRIFGQIYSDEGNQDAAIDSLTDALRWDPKNSYALLMMGNIFAKFKNDIPTAKKYYDLSLAYDPQNNIALNNIGANFLQLGQLEEGRRYLEIAYDVNPNYPNTSYGLAFYYQIIKNYNLGFSWAMKGLKSCDINNPIKKQLTEIIFSIAREHLNNFDTSSLVDTYIDHLHEKSKKKIIKQIDNSISTAAKIEFAENHARDHHIIRYQEKYPTSNHLIMHELVHLDFVLQAREFNASNKLFVMKNEHRVKFLKDHENHLKKLKQLGLSDEAITNFYKSLFDGISQQIYMAPIDLFIEEYLFNNYSELRPIQFLSMEILTREGIKAVTSEHKKFVPNDILDASTILNIVSALHLNFLYGVNYISLFVATQRQIKLANQFFNEFQIKKKDKNPGEEYEFVKKWGKELNLSEYFELVDEKNYNNDYLKNKLAEISNDPFSLSSPHPEDALKEPLNFSKEPAGQLAVTMYCLDALQYFQDKSFEQIKEVGVEIALLGTQGLDPYNSNKKLHLASIPNKEFTGLHLLAFMYVAWQTIDPTANLDLEFKNEYELAKQMFKKK